MSDADIGINPYRDLAKRFFITFVLGVMVYRFGAIVPVPGLNLGAVQDALRPGEGGVFQDLLLWANMFNGGAIANGAVFGLGIMPYISASIIMQLLAQSYPALKALRKEGEVGRRKINQYTRYLTLVICLAQSTLACAALARGGDFVLPGVDPVFFVVQAAVVVTTGSMVLLWLGEQITKHGVGNGVSVIIMIGILASFPNAFAMLLAQGDRMALDTLLIVLAIFAALIAGMVIITQARRFLHMEQQRRVKGGQVYGGAQTKLPLMLNQAGVIPVIFASPVMVVIGFVAGYIGLARVFDHGGVGYRYALAAMIVFFTYFYISITVDLNEWANNFKQSGFFIKGVKPGRNTVEHIHFRLMRLTFVGSLSLAAITIMPGLFGNWIGVSDMVAQVILGGVGLLIVVGVTLDIIQKVSAYLVAHQYQGMMLGRRDGTGSGLKPTRKPGTKRF